MVKSRVIMAGFAAALAAAAWSSQARATNQIADAIATPSGTQVEIDSAVVTAIIDDSSGNSYKNNTFLIQDSSGNIEAYGISVNTANGSDGNGGNYYYHAQVGDMIDIIAKNSPFNGAPEIGQLTAAPKVTVWLDSTSNAVALHEFVAADFNQTSITSLAPLTEAPGYLRNVTVTGVYNATTHVYDPIVQGTTTFGTVTSGLNFQVTDSDGNNIDIFLAKNISSLNSTYNMLVPAGPVDLFGYEAKYTPGSPAAYSPSAPSGYEFDLIGTPVAVPEPASMGLLAIGAASLVLRRRSAR